MANKNLPNLKDVSRVPEELLPVVYWWQDHGMKVLAYVVGIVLVAGAIYFWTEQRKANKSEALATLALSYPPAEFDALASSGGDAAPLAQLDQARSFYSAADYEGALQVYDKALKSLKGKPLEGVAQVGRICSLEALGRLDEALEAVNALEPVYTQAQPVHFLAAEVLCAKARILCQKGNKPEAKLALKPILDAPEASALAKYKPKAELLGKIIDAYAPKSLFEKAAEVTPTQPATPALPAAPTPTQKQ